MAVRNVETTQAGRALYFTCDLSKAAGVPNQKGNVTVATTGGGFVEVGGVRASLSVYMVAGTKVPASGEEAMCVQGGNVTLSLKGRKLVVIVPNTGKVIGLSHVKVDPKTGRQTGGNPMCATTYGAQTIGGVNVTLNVMAPKAN